MSYTDKFEAFSLIKNGSTYKLLPFSEQQNDQIKTTQDKTSTDKKTKQKKIKKRVNNKNMITIWKQNIKNNPQKMGKKTITLYF